MFAFRFFVVHPWIRSNSLRPQQVTVVLHDMEAGSASQASIYIYMVVGDRIAYA